MKWSGEAVFGPESILFRGISYANVVHAMPIWVLALSHDADSVILDARGGMVGGPVCLISPSTNHIVAADRPVTIAFLGPVRRSFEKVGIIGESSGFLQLDHAMFASYLNANPVDALQEIEKLIGPPWTNIDPRLVAAMEFLTHSKCRTSLSLAAENVGLSPSRLRAISQRDLGVSLSAWLTWRKLQAASRGVTLGDGLAESAASGGFADQAHFSNVMRRLLGTAPAEIKDVRQPL